MEYELTQALTRHLDAGGEAIVLLLEEHADGSMTSEMFTNIDKTRGLYNVACAVTAVALGLAEARILGALSALGHQHLTTPRGDLN